MILPSLRAKFLLSSETLLPSNEVEEATVYKVA